MDISEDRKADAVILALSGKLDATTAKAFENRILTVIDSGAGQRLVVDLQRRVGVAPDRELAASGNFHDLDTLRMADEQVGACRARKIAW